MLRSVTGAETAVTTSFVAIALATNCQKLHLKALELAVVATTGTVTGATIRITRDSAGNKALTREYTVTLLSGIGTSANMSATESLEGLSFDLGQVLNGSTFVGQTLYCQVKLTGTSPGGNVTPILHYKED